jgi:hypothetical protein
MPERDETDESIGALLTRLVDDGKTYARAEIGYYRALTLGKLNEAKLGLVLGVAALVLALAAAIGLVVGLVFTLATLVGPGYATLIVVIATLAIAGLLGWLAAGHIGRAFGSNP